MWESSGTEAAVVLVCECEHHHTDVYIIYRLCVCVYCICLCVREQWGFQHNGECWWSMKLMGAKTLFLCLRKSKPPPDEAAHAHAPTDYKYSYKPMQLCAHTVASADTHTQRNAPSFITDACSLTNTHTDTHRHTTTLLSVGTADKLLSRFLILFCVTAQESWNNTGNLKGGGAGEKEILENEGWRGKQKSREDRRSQRKKKE